MLTVLLTGGIMVASQQQAPVQIFKTTELFNIELLKPYLKNFFLHGILSKVKADDAVVLKDNGPKKNIYDLMILVNANKNLIQADKSTLTSLKGEEYISMIAHLIVVTNFDLLWDDIFQFLKKQPSTGIVTNFVAELEKELDFSKQGIFKLQAITPLLNKIFKTNTDLKSEIEKVLGNDFKTPAVSINTELITTNKNEKIEASSSDLTQSIALVNYLMEAAFKLVEDQSNKYVKPQISQFEHTSVHYFDGAKLVDLTPSELVDAAAYNQVIDDMKKNQQIIKDLQDKIKNKTPTQNPTQVGGPNNTQQQPDQQSSNQQPHVKKSSIILSDDMGKNIKNILDQEIILLKNEIDAITDPTEKQTKLKQWEQHKAYVENIKSISNGQLTLFIGGPIAVVGAGTFLFTKSVYSKQHEGIINNKFNNGSQDSQQGFNNGSQDSQQGN
jgi:hypothetical protein